ncbi:hypothetical protein GUJ93_ZPchr0121g52 [Zizania palustris]|uniref:Uncharacterized protein n=1 Tax=Zizania palustris TaxID=103762 RepID=A0A8J5RDB9_ZIZPA|nr:hypothetical protein GUJ93_ZPchr0121g52 [Zizania palustris]
MAEPPCCGSNAAGPFITGDSRVVALLDARSFRVLLDDSKVDKADTLDGTFMPSLALFGGTARSLSSTPPSPDTPRSNAS